MISMVIATRNRAYTLKRVAPSFFSQLDVAELIFVCDGCTDDTATLVASIGTGYPDKTLKIVVNEVATGQAQARNIGVRNASHDFIQFCDDDEYMEQGYARACREKLLAADAGVVSGRRIYLHPGESEAEAKLRFGNGMICAKPYLYTLCEYINAAKFNGDIRVPLVNSIMMTRKSSVERFPFETSYAKGNGYREESDFQMRLFLAGHDNITTNDVHTFHLPMSETRTGGQRVSSLRRIYWSCYYTNKFFGRFYRDYARKTGLRVPRPLAMALYVCFSVYKECLRPGLRDRYQRFRKTTA